MIAGLARMVHDVGLAEDLAQDALVAALEQWPATGVPRNPGAWLMAIGKRRAIDLFRRRERLARKEEELSHEVELTQQPETDELEASLDQEDVGDDLLRLVFTACHPVLSTEARVALTLRLLGGLTTDEIARAFLVPESTVAQRIVRAKRTLAEKHIPFEVPRGPELIARLPSVLEVVYLIFNEGYSATAGDDVDATGAVRGCPSAGSHPGRADAARARGARAGGTHGDPGLAHPRPGRPRRRAGAALRPGPGQVGSAADPARAVRARARRSARAVSRTLRAPGRDRRLPRSSAHARRDRLVRRSPSSTASSPNACPHRSSS